MRLKKIVPKLKNNETDFERDRRIFLNALPGVKTFQLFDDNPDRKDKKLTKIFHYDGELPVRYILRLEELNIIGAGIYICVNETNGKGRKATDIVKIRACFADFDDPNAKMPEFKIQPSMVVESSPNKFHVYFFSDNIPIDGFVGLQKAIIYNCVSDPKVHDLPRIMRVPGFFHNKNKPFMTRIVDYTGLKYDYGLLVDAFPPEPVKQWSAPKYQKKFTQDPNAEYRGSYGSSVGNRNCDLAKIIGGMLKNGRDWGYIESECFKHNSYSHPPLPDSEVRAVLKSMRRYL
jgi:hypothetical protein